MTSHLCRAVGCLTVCQHTDQFFCGEHWVMLSKTRRRIVVQWFRPELSEAKQPSPWHAGIHDAIASLASKETRLEARDKHEKLRETWHARALVDGSYLDVRALTADERFELEELLRLGLRTAPTIGQLRGYWGDEVFPALEHIGSDAWRRLYEVALARIAVLNRATVKKEAHHGR